MDATTSAFATATSEQEFVISRTFDAPSAQVWKAWTESDWMAQWFGPHSFTNQICQMDVRPGGAYRIVMRAPTGDDYPIKGNYREINAPERLVIIDDCSEHSAARHAQV